MKKSTKNTITGVLATIMMVLAGGYVSDDIPVVSDLMNNLTGQTVTETQKDNKKEQESENIATVSVDTDRMTEQDIPGFNGTDKFVYINDNKSNIDINTFQDDMNGSQLLVSDLDDYNRAGVAKAYLKPETYRSSKNRSTESNISNIHPTGWKNKQIGKSKSQTLYNRSHLIGYAMLTENLDTPYNMITGTAEFNQSKSFGMQKFETIVQDAVSKDNKTVMYEVTPLFKGEDAVARGVQMRALSTDGTVDFNVFVHNVQEGYEINYGDGTSKVAQ